MEQATVQPVAEPSAAATAASPGDPPRDVTSAAVRKHAWTEPRVRLWWLLGLGVAVLMLYVLATQAANWWAERKLLTEGVAVQAVIIRAKNDLNDITVPDKRMPPDSVCVLKFEHNGRSHEVMGQLPEHIERGQHVVTGPMNPVTLHIDPNDPTRWTDRTTSPPFLSRQMIGVAIGMPVAVLLLLVALMKRRGVLRVWRDGRTGQALVVGTGQTPVAPRSRAVRCTPADSADKRVFTVYLPAGAAPAAAGDLLWVVRPADKPEPCYAAGWFVRSATPMILLAILLALPGCASKCKTTDLSPPAPATSESAMASSASKPSTQPERFTGTLRGGIIAVGAETTGWVLETDDGKRVDVELSKAGGPEAAAGLDGKRVTIIGGMTTANWVERGEKPLLIAERIEAEK